MADVSAEEILAAEYLRELYAQVDGAPGGVAPASHLQQALGWEDALFHQIGQRLHEAGLVRRQTGSIRLVAEGKATVEDYEPAPPTAGAGGGATARRAPA